jgi:UDP-N-acetylglucosamine 2-epimerase (hydrolysing)
MSKHILFVSGTRADFGKQKPMMLEANKNHRVSIFVTGMHMLSKYGSTWNEIRDVGVGEIYPFVNQNAQDNMASTLSKTLQGLNDFVLERKPDLLIVHGDRIEALAGALAGLLTNTPVAHIEGGEVSGTVDEMVRHSISKLASTHFVANQEAREILLQMGEQNERIFEIGSPDVDIMLSSGLPNLQEVRTRYDIPFTQYAIAIFHPVVTEIEQISEQSREFFEALVESNLNYVVIEPNNDPGSETIRNYISSLKNNPRFRVYPSMRFEYFLTLLKNCQLIIGNSSAGIREAPYFGVPCVDVGSRQSGRNHISTNTFNCPIDRKSISSAIGNSLKIKRIQTMPFGNVGSAKRFATIISSETFWELGTQKSFEKLKLPLLLKLDKGIQKL